MCVDTADYLSVADSGVNGTFSESFDITAPGAAGTYDFSFRARDSDSTCTGGGSNLFTLTDGIIVVDGITLLPATGLNHVDTAHTVTASVDEGTLPVSGAKVRFDITAGPNTGKFGLDTTDSGGEATFTYTGDGGTGTDTIEVCFDLDNDGSCDDGSPTDSVTKEWVRVVDDDGKIGLNSSIECDEEGVTVVDTIQAAVDAALVGDTIFVCPSDDEAGVDNDSDGQDVYLENVVVNKAVSLQGIENSPKPIVDAGGIGSAITIPATATGVSIDLFTATNSGTGSGAAGILVEGDGNFITNNMANDNGNDGIQVNGNGNTIGGSGNMANDNARDGIHLGPDASGNTVSSNEAKDNGGDGIYVDGDGNFILNNNGGFNNNDGHGIHLTAGADGNTVDGNIANHNGHGGVADGIFVAGGADGNEVTNNTAFHNGNWGINVVGVATSGDRKDISRNHVYENGLDGIRIAGDYYDLHNNNIHDNEDNGILVEGDNNLLRLNNPHHNEEDGIHLTGNNNTLEKNNAHHNDDCGFEDNGNGNSFPSGKDKNKSHQNGDNGIPCTP